MITVAFHLAYPTFATSFNSNMLPLNTDDWCNGMDLGQLVGLVFIDLKMAFDTVDRKILHKSGALRRSAM